MSTIDDLPIPNFADLSEDALVSLIRATRGRRATPDPALKASAKAKAISSRAKREKQPVSASTVSAQVASLTDDQKRQLLKQLTGE